MLSRAWQQKAEARRQRLRRFALFAVPVGLVLAVTAWLFAGDIFGADHPFGDARACPGSDTALAPALQQEQISLPLVATGLHYTTHESAGKPAADYSFEAVFHTTRQALVDYLAGQGLADPDRSAHPDEANDGSETGEPVGEGMGCGVGRITGTFVSIPKDLDVNRRFTVAVELGRDFRIPADPEVFVTVT
ncbi:hypothetical protein SAMN05216223_12754 [Actinacidiphila yanglinensis]|uniref:Uncharacterized protein n=1 Tax=Actinacidiphila yanglinensis TaxID=310779 RepID=A0A1H6E689_9ACTN|nr:hypothetical protein [Actinacidiphila yanglinensis]SEG93212.1 hypothetical protein SAMN05216223_12754 [Actinacidiphila yanglinensis]